MAEQQICLYLPSVLRMQLLFQRVISSQKHQTQHQIVYIITWSTLLGAASSALSFAAARGAMLESRKCIRG